MTAKTSCAEAMRKVIHWLPVLPCLPVAESDPAHRDGILGFVHPGDLLVGLDLHCLPHYPRRLLSFFLFFLPFPH
ncbi:unnamed protein product [Protopolystoma xenopodis]|uniref:Uncharacterized protein n=1 Tax=Protopolystoma xenopodis TaxID=117903 RepID=A0A3S4ZU80_9PLAT|nr:unnamed protein product [Protopolystoma xenopodis]